MDEQSISQLEKAYKFNITDLVNFREPWLENECSFHEDVWINEHTW